MAVEHLEILQLDSHRVRTAVDFFTSYANFVVGESRTIDVNRAALADAATALRIAGQWAMLLDPGQAVELLTRSAGIWQRMQFGFGSFLLAAVSPGELSRFDLLPELVLLAEPFVRRAVPIRTDLANQGQTLPPPLSHPQQQVYFLLAGAAMARRFDLPIQTLRAIIEQSPHRQGVAPMGALGTPLRVYWQTAGRLLTDDGDEPARLIAADLADMARAYAEAIDSAMANSQLWFNAAAPVDVGDLDIAAIALVASRRLGPDLMMDHLRRAGEDLSALARVPLQLASEMIDASSQGLA
jgi:hypothetical protein